MPTKVLATKTPPKKTTTRKAVPSAPAKRRSSDPWLKADQPEERDHGRNWLPKEKARNWLKNR
jgi:hypothetical protein